MYKMYHDFILIHIPIPFTNMCGWTGNKKCLCKERGRYSHFRDYLRICVYTVYAWKHIGIYKIKIEKIHSSNPKKGFLACRYKLILETVFMI